MLYPIHARLVPLNLKDYIFGLNLCKYLRTQQYFEKYLTESFSKVTQFD